MAASFPEAADKDFVRALSRKKEFVEAAKRVEPREPLQGFQATRAQRVVKRFLAPGTPYNALLLYHGVGAGKCHAYDTPILMQDGSVKMVQDVKLGDELMGDDSKPRRVLSLARGEGKMYDVIPVSCGWDAYTVNSEHVLVLRGTDGVCTEITVNQYNALPRAAREAMRGFRVPVEFPPSATPEDPYHFARRLPSSAVGIPRPYKVNSRAVRLSVLAGLLDAVGYVRDGQDEYMVEGLTSRLANDVVYVARSLGFAALAEDTPASCAMLDQEGTFVVSMCGQGLEEVPVRARLLRARARAAGACRVDETNICVASIGPGEYYGFTLDGNGRYLLGDFTVTHNTCTAIQVAHQFPGRPALVLSPRALVGNFEKEVYDVGKAPGQQCIPRGFALKRRVDARRLARAEYQIMGFFQFINFMHALMPDSKDQGVYRDRVKKTFSTRVIIIDEVHNIRTDDEVSTKQLPPLLRDMITMADDVKLVLMSATPMFNRANEIVDVLNLLRLVDRRAPVREADLFDPRTGELVDKRLLAEAARGYVSYVRGGDDQSQFPMRVQPPVPAAMRCLKRVSPFIVCSTMSKEHESACMAERRVSGNSMILLQHSNILFPGGIDAVLRRLGREQFTYADPRVAPALTPVKGALGKIGTKLQTIVDSIVSRPNGGKVFIYSFFVDHGLLPLAIALEHAGFTRAFGLPVLVAKGVSATPVSPKGSYALLSSETRDIASVITAFNDPSNADGNRIRVLLGTSVLAEGIDLKCVRDVHVMEPWFHMNKIEQVVGRAVRRNSHALLPPSERDVRIWLHAATYSGDAMPLSPDVTRYVMAAEKQRVISEVEDVLRENAIDAGLMADDRTKTLKEPIDSSTFSAAHVQEMVPLYSHLVRCALSSAPGPLTLAQLQDALSSGCLGEGSDAVDDETLYQVLSSMVDSRRVRFSKGRYSGGAQDLSAAASRTSGGGSTGRT